MADPFVGEIRAFPFNYAPRGWALCNGQTLPIQQNTALFALLGTNYGGNGSTNFKLPDLQGAIPIHAGSGAGLNAVSIGQSGGAATVTLSSSQMPSHTHAMRAGTLPANATDPTNAQLTRSSGAFLYATPPAAPTTMATSMVSVAGGSQPHNNLMPYLTLNFCIALLGIFPPRP